MKASAQTLLLGTPPPAALMVESADVNCREDGVPVASLVFDLKAV